MVVLSLASNLPKHVLPWPLIAPDHAVSPLAPERDSDPLCHEPQQPLIALIQRALDKQLQGDSARSVSWVGSETDRLEGELAT